MSLDVSWHFAREHGSSRKEKAINSFDKAIELKADFHAAWMYRALAWRFKPTFQEAVASYDRAIEIQPDYEDAWIRRRYAIFELYKLKRFEFLLASWEKVLKMKPENAEGWYYKAYTLCQSNQYREAIISYDKAIEINPDYAKHGKAEALRSSI
jgi:tetratricopeptide (TPR) repeat protein